jgi:membrane-associated phospholipid phosphatase
MLRPLQNRYPMFRDVSILLVKHSKFLILGSNLIVLCIKHDASTLAITTGFICSDCIGKGLKRVVKCKRPSTSKRTDNGMPSNHALVSMYYATYLTLVCKDVFSIETACFLSMLMYGYAFLICWSRVYMTLDHYIVQVVCGALVGACSGVSWYQLFKAYLY